MSNNRKVVKQEALKIGLNVVIVVLVLILLVMIMIMVNSFKGAFAYPYKENSFSYDIGYQDYIGIVYKYYNNKGIDYEGNPEVQEYHGVARYYEAASLYKAYVTAGNEEKALLFHNKMKQAESRMGDWIIVKESIHKSLEIEE